MKTFFETNTTSIKPVSDSEDDDIDEEIFDTEFNSDELNKFTCDKLLEKIRKIFRKLKKSPLKNEYLQKYVIEKHGKSLEAVLDCKTRWNSTISMVERFLSINDCIEESCLFEENFSDFEISFLNVFCYFISKIFYNNIIILY